MINFKNLLKKYIFYFVGFFLSITVTLLLLEICLRFLPVNEGLRAQAVNQNSPIFKFKPNRKALFSKNWNFDIINNVNVNNAGFINNNDYNSELKSKLLSIIGDSYVEALMVPFEDNMSGILAKKANDKRVYSFAASGAGLSQHLIWAKHARENYNSNFFVFVIISNDFSESLAKYGSSPGFHRFKIKKNNEWELLLSNYEPSLLRKVFRNSSLAMYLITNLKIHSRLNMPLKLGKYDNRKKYVSNFDANVSANFWNDSVTATDIYLNNILKFTGSTKDKILFVIDGIRPELYDDNNIKVRDSFWYKMRNYFIEEANKKGYEVIDMQKIFINEYKEKNLKYEFKTDSHWNSHGHATVAKSIIESSLWKSFIKQ